MQFMQLVSFKNEGGTMAKISLGKPINQDLPIEPATLRALIRRAGHTGHTSGLAPRRVQANLAILPADWAAEFLLFCQMNPKPCPVLAVTNPGDPIFRTLGTDVDVRTDAPRDQVFRDGALTDEPTDLLEIWRDDLVAFAIGCSFSFEEALLEVGLRLRHHDEGLNPESIGIKDLGQPDFGDAVSVAPGELPVFWACGASHHRPSLPKRSRPCSSRTVQAQC
jgi:uncharacterized protein YcsI (UPF0317 family)